MKKRCTWSGSEKNMIAYHDKEWGRPLHDDRLLFEFLILEGAQAGLSWSTILNKRDGYRAAFADFDAKKLVRFTAPRRKKLMDNAAIVRNRLKIDSVFSNAQAYLDVQEEYGSFAEYMWGFIGGKPLVNKFKKLSDIPAETDASQAMSKALKKRGFRFVGPTICYAFMQATGMVNDHTIDCFRYPQLAPRPKRR